MVHIGDGLDELREYAEMILGNIISHTARTQFQQPYTLTPGDCEALTKYLPHLLSEAAVGREAIKSKIEWLKHSPPPPIQIMQGGDPLLLGLLEKGEGQPNAQGK